MAGQWGRAAFDAVGPLLLIGWSEVGPALLAAMLHAGMSGHLLWIGDRTRDPDGPHVEYAASIANPIAVKLGPTATPGDALRLVRRLNPMVEPGRLTMITRMGARLVYDRLPPIVEQVTATGIPVGWVCDPMHGNTVLVLQSDFVILAGQGCREDRRGHQVIMNGL
jgi:hypothetical protein